MNILYVVSGFAPAWGLGGGVRASYELSREMVNRGHEVVVYTTDILDYKNRISYSYKNWFGVKTYYFKAASNLLAKRQLNFSTKFIWHTYKNITDFDIIHIHEYRTINGTFVAYLAKRNAIPYIIQPHGSLPTTIGMKKFKKFYDAIIGKKILKNAFKVLALNDMEFEQYKEMEVEESIIELIPNGINTSEFANLPPRGLFKSKYEIKENEKIILYLGRINKIKGIDLLIESFAELCLEINEVKLVIVGPDNGFLSTLKTKIKMLNIENKVLFTGPLFEQNKIEAYVDADVYVLPSKYEIFGLTVLEACSCNTPIIVTKNCGISYIVKDRVGLVTDFDKSQLKLALSMILKNESLRKKFSNNGKKFIETSFDWKKIAEKMEDIYETSLF